jgi:hypothetical protein
MHTNKEKAQVLSQSVLKLKDIRVLLDCGNCRASEEAKGFRKWFEDDTGFQTRAIPTEYFIRYAKINEKRILDYANKGY